MAQEKYLITGGAGFIGSHLVDYLLSKGSHVVVLDNFRNGDRCNLPNDSENENLDILHGDITDRDTCRMAMKGIKGVFHLACLGVRHSIHNPIENHQVNALGTLYVLEAAKEAGVERFLYMSTSEIYGRAETFPITEDTTPWPLTVYGSSKLAGEHYARSYYECYGMNTICVRCFNNYGPRAHFEGDSGEVIPRFMLRVMDGKSPQIFGDGSHTRDFLFVKDSVRYLYEIMHCRSLAGEVFNLGFGEEITVGKLAETIISLSGNPEIGIDYLDERPADVPRLWVDTSKLKKHFPLNDLYGFDKGIEETLTYYKALHKACPGLSGRIKTKNWEGGL